jgi:hypothetical protein
MNMTIKTASEYGIRKTATDGTEIPRMKRMERSAGVRDDLSVNRRIRSIQPIPKRRKLNRPMYLTGI